MRTRAYRSYEEFEREQLKVYDSLRSTIDDLIDEMFVEELDFDADGGGRGRGRRAADEDEE